MEAPCLKHGVCAAVQERGTGGESSADHGGSYKTHQSLKMTVSLRTIFFKGRYTLKSRFQNNSKGGIDAQRIIATIDA